MKRTKVCWIHTAFEGVRLCLGYGPLTVTVGNEGLVRDSLLKMVHNPGGHWHPGRGPHPSYAIRKCDYLSFQGRGGPNLFSPLLCRCTGDWMWLENQGQHWVTYLVGWAPSGCKWWLDHPHVFQPWSLPIWKGNNNPILRGRTQSPWLLTTYPSPGTILQVTTFLCLCFWWLFYEFDFTMGFITMKNHQLENSFVFCQPP